MEQNPFRQFIGNSLEDFRKHLNQIGMKDSTIDQRMRGATEFARYLIGDPHEFNEQTKGTM